MNDEAKKVMMMLSIVEAEKGHKLIELLEKQEIKMNMQIVGYGTAPTEMMDIFGLGSNDKDIMANLISFMSGKIGFLGLIVIPILVVCSVLLKESMKSNRL